MNPTQNALHVNRPLTNILVAYTQSQDIFVAGKVFATVPVAKPSDKYFIYRKGDWFRGQAKKRGRAQETRGLDWNVDQGEYSCEVEGIHHDIDDKDRSSADLPIVMDSAATELVAHDLLISKEIDWATNYFTTGIWTGSTTGGDITPSTLWDASGSTPLADIRAQMRAMKTKTGRKPNKIIFPSDVWAVLQDHPDITGRMAITNSQIVTKQIVAAMLELDEVLEAGAVRNTAVEGATDVMADIFSKDVLLVYAEPRPAIMKPSAGYTFQWTGYLGNSPQGYVVKRYRMEHLASDRIEGEMAHDHKLVASDCGVFFDDVIS